MPAFPTADSRSRVLAAALVFALALLAYANTLGNGFVFDDRAIIEGNPALRSASGIPGLWTSPYWTGEGRGNRLYRPLTTTSYALNWIVGGPSPFSFHLLNALLHAGTALLLFALLERLFALRILSGAASALFAVHPALSEAVAAAVGRADLLAALLILAALVLDRGGGPATARWRWGSPVAFAAALFAKESAVIYPGLLYLTDRAAGRPAAVSAARRRLEYALTLLVLGGYLLARRGVLGILMEPAAIPVVDNPLAAASPAARLFSALYLATRYLRLFLFPRHLSADYSAPQILPVEGWGSAEAWWGLIVAGGLAGLAWGTRRRLSPLAWGIGFAAIAFLPVSNLLFPIGTIFAERLLYLPAAGLSAAVGFVAAVAAVKRKRLVVAVGLAVLALCLGRTWERNRDWRDDFTLFESAARVSPRSARVQFNLGNAFRRRGEPEMAVRHYRQALELWPDYEPASRNLGVILTEQGKPAEAVELLRTLVDRHPDRSSIWNNLGNALREAGKLAEAERAFLRARELDPASPDPANNLGVLRQRRGDSAGAAAAYEEAIRLAPDRVAFRLNLGNLLLGGGDSRAAGVFTEAVRRDPASAPARRGLGEALLGAGKTDEAERELRRSLELDPDQWEAPALLGYLAQRRGNREEAVRLYQASLARNPDQMELHRNLGVIYSQNPAERGKAIEHLRRCLALNPPAPVAATVRELLDRLESADPGDRARPE